MEIYEGRISVNLVNDNNAESKLKSTFVEDKVSCYQNKSQKKRTKITPLNISYTYILNTKKREQSSPSLHSKITL